MQFLRTVLWIVLTVVVVTFGYNNWQLTEVRLWSDLVWTPPLGFALLVAFLLGLIPGLILHRTTRWSLRRKLEAVTRNQFVEPTTSVAPPAAISDPIPPQLR